jgi:hypothetical protein
MELLSYFDKKNNKISDKLALFKPKLKYTDLRIIKKPWWDITKKKQLPVKSNCFKVLRGSLS